MAIRKEYRQQLLSLQNELNEMGNLCILSVQLAMSAVTSGEEKLIRQTIETHETIGKEEREIESLCLRLLLQQQPVASDLRRISSALKMVYDLQRIGEQSADIADIARFVLLKESTAARDIADMAKVVIQMVRDSISAYADADVKLSQSVITADDQADEWFVRIKDDLVREISADHANAEYCLEALMTAKYLEKIGDHAQNVAEWAAYAVTGHLPH